jgi:hypothetical protein
MTKSDTYTLKRKVLIRESDVKTLKRHSLIESPHGNKQLYDSVDWKPITSNDLLIDTIRGIIYNNPESLRRYFVTYHAHTFYDSRYRHWSFDINSISRVLEISGNNVHWQPFGWAVLIKELPKPYAKKAVE